MGVSDYAWFHKVYVHLSALRQQPLTQQVPYHRDIVVFIADEL